MFSIQRGNSLKSNTVSFHPYLTSDHSRFEKLDFNFYCLFFVVSSKAMQENKPKIIILRAYRPLLTCLTVYKRDNFHSSDGRILIRNICRATVLTIFFGVYMCVFLATEFFVSCSHNFNLNEIVQPLSFFLITSPLTIIYFIMFWKCNKVIDILNSLDGIVVESKFFSILYLLGVFRVSIPPGFCSKKPIPLVK